MNVRAAGSVFIDRHFHALTHRNYRYLWTGQCVSLIGTWMQNIGQSWLVLTLTGSPLKLGMVTACQFLPILLFSLFAGIIVDKFPKKNILLVTQTVSMILAFTLATLVLTHTVRYEFIIVLALLLGLNNTLDMPTRQAFNIEIVGKEDLMNAIALNSTTFNMARIVGPSIGAVMMAWLGAGWCFLLNGVSFIAVLYGILQIQTAPYVRKKTSRDGVFKEIKDGIVYIARDPVLAQTVLLVTVIGTLAFNFNILIPVFTRNVLQLGETTYGTLMSCLGIGSFAGALTMSFRSKKGPRLKISMIASLVVASCLILNGLSTSVWLCGGVLALTGFFNIMFATNSNSNLQMNAKEEYRARVMSVYALVFAGSTPFGSLFAGYVADRFGANGAFVVCGLLTGILCLIIIWKFRKTGEKKSVEAI
ncbi:MFS transporter [Paenibacillus chondroitinus]|uniref:MFS transporter n=1 Tax=Paenibacillus chondroitinus TaxID=59842 RepID=A0ABU6DCW0_9BACL|nr:MULTISPECIES: MFS transporter [Paenibacillus]MCY9662976.1 MFS transporter [Paenibacillus anseongense]MEB4795597.1 MFS transporter [Paenibacillus chondroitinus]